MDTQEFKSIGKLVKIICFYVTFPLLIACGAAIEPDGTITITSQESTQALSQDSGAAGQNSQTGTPGATNSAPVANAGSDQNVTVNSYIELDGSKSIDADGDSITYKWELFSFPGGSTSELAGTESVSPSFTPDVAGIYEFRLTVSDGKELSYADTVFVSAAVGNSAPVASAGSDQSTTVGSTITLDGSGSTDFNGDTLSYLWVLSSIPSGSVSTLSASTASNPQFTPDVIGVYTAELTVDDGMESSVVDSVDITVALGNAAPVADAGSDQSAGNYSLVTLDGSGSSDSNGDSLSYSWSVVSYPQGGSSPVLSAPFSVSTTFTPEVTGTYVLSLAVSDGELTSSLSMVSISVSPLTATLSWTAPTTNVDSSPLTDLAGYKILYGTSSGVYTKTKSVASGATSETISGFSKATYYFVILAYDTFGNESEYSLEVSKIF